jgi:hypothetical protein
VPQEPDAAHGAPHDGGTLDVRLLVRRDAHHQDVAGTVLLRDVPDSREWLVVALTPAECAPVATAMDEVRPVSSTAAWAEELGEPAQDASSPAPQRPDAESSDEVRAGRPMASGEQAPMPEVSPSSTVRPKCPWVKSVLSSAGLAEHRALTAPQCAAGYLAARHVQPAVLESVARVPALAQRAQPVVRRLRRLPQRALSMLPGLLPARARSRQAQEPALQPEVLPRRAPRP